MYYNVVTILFIILIASCDEIHQAFVLQRGSYITDVYIDVISGVVGIYDFIILKTSGGMFVMSGGNKIE